MDNLWNETIKVLENNNHSWDDVLYVACNDFMITKENFEEVAKGTNYDDGFGGIDVAEDLVIIGDIWWLSREDYDGSEWWRYNEKPDVSKFGTIKISKLAEHWRGDQGLQMINNIHRFFKSSGDRS